MQESAKDPGPSKTFLGDNISAWCSSHPLIGLALSTESRPSSNIVHLTSLEWTLEELNDSRPDSIREHFEGDASLNSLEVLNESLAGSKYEAFTGDVCLDDCLEECFGAGPKNGASNPLYLDFASNSCISVGRKLVSDRRQSRHSRISCNCKPKPPPLY